MKHLMVLILTLLLLLLSLLSCCDFGKHLDGGPCSYKTIPGVSTIRSVTSREKENPYYEDVVIVLKYTNLEIKLHGQIEEMFCPLR